MAQFSANYSLRYFLLSFTQSQPYETSYTLFVSVCVLQGLGWHCQFLTPSALGLPVKSWMYILVVLLSSFSRKTKVVLL